MIVKSLKCLFILFSCTMLRDQMITWYRHMISDIGTCHAILDTWYLTLVLAMLYLTLDIWHRYLPYLTLDIWRWYLPCYTWHLTCYDLVLIHLTWYCDTWLITVIHCTLLYCIFMIITFTGTWHDYYTVTKHLVLLNSCTLELLYSWTRVTGRLLILCSC